MEWVETTARTVDEAKEAALDELGVDESDAEFQVIEEPRSGLFGRLRGEARVRARVRPTVPRPKEDRRSRRQRRVDSGSSGRGPAGTASPVVAVEEENDLSTSSDAGGDQSAGTAEADVESGAAARPAGAAGSRKRRRRRRSGSGGGTSAGNSDPDAVRAEVTAGDADAEGGGDIVDASGAPRVRPAEPGIRGSGNGNRETRRAVPARERGGADVEVALDEQGRIAREFVTGLIAEVGLDAQVAVVRPDEETVGVNLTGPNLGILIGPKGSTLLAIQDLARTVVHHQTGATNGRIHVDVGGYRQKRADALSRFASDVAERVRTSGARTALEPMTPADRKVVHDAIQAIPGVSTVSEGEEPNRRVVILPSDS